MLRATLLMASLVGAAAGQDPAPPRAAEPVRKPSFARVVDAAGKPIEAAEVVFCGIVPHLGSSWVPPDVVRATSDARGRARADLLPGWCYMAWAVGPADERGVRQGSMLHGFTGAAAMFDLECSAPVPPAEVRCTGAEAWQALAPLRWFVAGPFVGVEHELLPDADGRASLPPLPPRVAMSCSIEVRTAAGDLLWSSSPLRNAELPPPCELELEVKDDKGDPLAGARVRHRVVRRTAPNLDVPLTTIDEGWRLVGMTGPEGRVTVQVPFAGDPFALADARELLLFVEAAGKAGAVVGFRAKQFYAGDEQAAVPEDRRLRCALKAASPLEGQLLAAPGQPVAGLQVLLQVSTMLRSGTGSFSIEPRSFVTAVGADGRFVFDGVPDQVRSTWLVLLPPPGGDPLALPLVPGSSSREVPGSIALAKAVPLRLRIRDERGGPAVGAQVFVVPLEGRSGIGRESIVRSVVGPAGALDIQVMPGRWGLLALSATGLWTEEITTGGDGAELQRALTALPTMRLRLLDADGAPVRGARLMVRSSASSGVSDALQSLLQQLARRPMSGMNLSTDADGAMEIPVLAAKNYSMRFVLTHDGKQTEMVTLEAMPPEEPPIELRLR